MLDIDYFKQLNDTYGHDIGDKVLVALSQLISKHLRTNDIFARYGGEEFMILLPRTNVDIAYQKAEELRTLIDDHKNKIPHFTASFGVTKITEYDKEQSAFIRVDKALYQAKVKRNDVVQL
jgi:diguanylate cyclase (GGDEF)-like protein